MTEQELRESIFYIIMSRKFTDSFGDEMGIDEEMAKQLADALLAAGIGDINEWKRKAEVAERALDLCETAYILSLNHGATEGISGQAIASDLGVHKFFMEQAEKELAEEGKDD